jgi:hypothetical protein
MSGVEASGSSAGQSEVVTAGDAGEQVADTSSAAQGVEANGRSAGQSQVVTAGDAVAQVADTSSAAPGSKWVVKNTTGVDDCPTTAASTKTLYTPQGVCYHTWNGEYELHSCNSTYYKKQKFENFDDHCSGTATYTKEVAIGCTNKVSLSCGVTNPMVTMRVYPNPGCTNSVYWEFFEPLGLCVTKSSTTSTKATCVNGQFDLKYYQTSDCDPSGGLDTPDFWSSYNSSSCKGPDPDYGEFYAIHSGCSA